jgi:cysteine desulfuration protein SufE
MCDAAATSPMTALDDIAETLELFDDWEQRYAYLVELGERLPRMPAELKSEENRVKGCMSRVWVSAYSDQAQPHIIHFHGDCDTSIIKGVLALLIQLTDGRTAQQIQQLDIEQFFSRLKLDQHLSPSRHFGVYAIVELMKQQAAQQQPR